MNVTQYVILGVLAAIIFVLLRLFLLGGSRIPADKANEQVSAGTAVLVDVREPEEWSSGVAGPAVLLSLSDLRGERRLWDRFLQANKDKLLILYCASGVRSGLAVGILKKEGYRAANLGGYARWKSAGLPLRRP